ncbi:hypothetical protein Pfo_021638 [Paulownia fortunei]|nr:hypothetical protein Pfo_021638 [Paulownia fortunei]
MELRSCGSTHFIQTIRGGLVIKVCNINSRGRPVIGSKILKDIYEDEDSKRLRRPSTGLVFDYEQVKSENPCFPVADRTLWEMKPKTHDEFVPRADKDLDSGLDDNTTLKQLKKQFLTKKRKCINSDENSKQHNANEKPVEDDSDLNEPLINWKPKRSKTSKAKRKCMNLSVVSSSTIDFAIKSEENLVSEGSPQVDGELAPVTSVKVEVPDPMQLGCQNKTSSADASSIAHDEGLNPGGIASNEFPNMVLREYRESLLCAYEYQNCVTNENSYNHLEDVEPISMLLPWDGMSVKLETLESDCDEILDLHSTAIEKQKEIRDAHSCRSSLSEDPNADVCCHSRSSSSMEDISEQRTSSGIQVPDMTIDGVDGCMGLHQEFNSVLFEDKTEAGFPYELDDSLSSPDKNCGSYPDSIISLKTEEDLVSMEDTIADEEQPSICSFDTRNGLNCEGHFEHEFLKAEEKQTSVSPIMGAESQSSLKNQTCDSADIISTLEQRQPPERLLSTRKAISPSSQERLCLSMNSVEIWNDADQNKCKGKLLEKQTGKKASFLRSDIQYDTITVNHRRPRQVSQRKVIISPRHIIKKSQIAKGNLEGPRFSRALPNLSTGCTSIQGCSESAVVFSQRQMHHMESLAMKLMNELKSMKDIVEQKLLFEAYRNVSLKNDADEVKSAINNATKVEEMARKWLSIMARDCNRFCKIMKMTPNSTAAPKDTVPRERRKIMFADETGGKLCYVKFFEDGTTSPVSDDDVGQ